MFNREGLEGQREVILCEALIDALTFWNAGYHNVTSCYGVNGMTDEVLAALKACGAQRILIAFDRDDPGDRAADELAKKLMGEGLDCFRLLFPKGMDANEYAQPKVGTASFDDAAGDGCRARVPDRSWAHRSDRGGLRARRPGRGAQ